MRKLIYASKDEYPIITKDIHPNDFPDGWREITPEEFSTSDFFSYSPEYIEYRQMYDNHKAGVHAKLFHFPDGTGIAMSNEYWEKKVRFYKFGCEHSYNELSTKQASEEGVSHFGNCYHVYKCSKCNHVMSQDSSG